VPSPAPSAGEGDGPVPAAPVEAADAAGLTPALRLEAVRDFLREVGYSDQVLDTMDGMVLYTRGRSGI